MIPTVKRFKSTIASIALLATGVLIGCGDQSRNPQLVALAQEVPASTPAPAVVMRINRGSLHFYTLPNLEDAGWSIDDRANGARRLVGFASPQEQLLVLSDDSILKAYDLRGGLIRTVDSTIQRATIGPDGIPYVVDKGGSVGAVEQRQISIWADSVAANTQRIWGALGGRLLTETTSPEARVLRLFSRNRSPVRVVLPAGPMALSPWSELAAVATSNAIELYQTRDASAEPQAIALPEEPLDVAFSAAGHLLFVTTTPGRLLTYDRYTGTLVDSTTVPGTPGSIRPGRLGQLLFVRDGELDTANVFDTSRRVFAGRVATRWTNAAPMVAPDGSIIVETGNALIALDPATFRERGRIQGEANDIWTVAQWDPVRPVSQQHDQIVADQYDEEGQSLYVQVSSSQNMVWAQDFATRLARAGMEAMVLDPEEGEELYRVVLGPYTSRDEAEAAGRTLGRPYWIFSPPVTEKTP